MPPERKEEPRKPAEIPETGQARGGNTPIGLPDSKLFEGRFGGASVPTAIINTRSRLVYRNPALDKLDLDPTDHKSIVEALKTPNNKVVPGTSVINATTRGILDGYRTIIRLAGNSPHQIDVSPVPGLDENTYAKVEIRPEPEQETIASLLAEIQRLQEENKRLETRFTTLNATTEGFVHDFKNRLTAISGNASLLSYWKNLPPDKIADIIGAIVSSAKQAHLEVIETLASMDVWRESKPKVIAVTDLIKSVVDKNTELLKTKNIEVTIFPTDESLTINVDPRKLISALSTIVLNATQHGADKVRIWYRTKDGFVTIYVGDNGTGMSEETLARCFEDGFTTRQNTDLPGSGKGLSIAKQNVESGGGKMLPPLSAIGIGSIFAAALPLVREEN